MYYYINADRTLVSVVDLIDTVLEWMSSWSDIFTLLRWKWANIQQVLMRWLIIWLTLTTRNGPLTECFEIKINQWQIRWMEINLSLACFITSISFFGFPLHFEIIIRILYDETLRTKLLYIIQLAIVFFHYFNPRNLFHIHYIDFVIGPTEFLCHIFISFFAGIPYNCFLLHYLLYLIDYCLLQLPIFRSIKQHAAVSGGMKAKQKSVGRTASNNKTTPTNDRTRDVYVIAKREA